MEPSSRLLGPRLMRARWLSAWMGIWFASLQAGYFLCLETSLTATYLTYVLVVACWLVGAMVGLAIAWDSHHRLMLLALVSYAVVTWLAHAAPSDRVWPAAVIGMVVGGIVSGQFFAMRQGLFPHVGWLFFWENTGFLIGWTVVMAGWMLFGEGILWWVPGLSGGCAFITSRLGFGQALARC